MSSPSVVLLQARRATTLIFLVNGMGLGAWAASIPTLKSQLELVAADLSAVLLAMTLGAMLCMPLTGLLVARLGGAGRLIRHAGLAFMVILCLPGLAIDLPTLVLAAFLLGAGSGLLDVAMNAYAGLIERDWPRPIMSSIHAAWSLGGMLGAGSLGLLLRAGVPVFWLLLLNGLLMGATVVLAGRGLKLDQDGREHPAGLCWPNRAILGIGSIALLTFMVEGGVADWGGVYLHEVLQVSTAGATSAFACFSLAMFAGRLIGDRLVHELGRVRVLVFGALLAALGQVLVVVSEELLPALSGFALTGLGLSNLLPVALSLSSRLSVSPAVGISMAATMGYFGLLAGPPLIGLITALSDLRQAMLFLALVCLLVLGLSAYQR